MAMVKNRLNFTATIETVRPTFQVIIIKQKDILAMPKSFTARFH